MRYSRVKEWRSGHRHDPAKTDAPEPDKQGSQASTELSWQDPRGIVQARIGFSMEAH
ncbi:hypothetical protein [Cryobacterium melibiosiphilum]|nr:hypothetical protein [Cryobacterium melibiosiphilum]